MRAPQALRAAAARWDIAIPAGGGLPGVSMAGFRSRTSEQVDLQVIPYPAVTVLVDLGDAVLIDRASGDQHRGCSVAGLAPGSVRGSGSDIECLQIRLSPVVAHAVLGAAAELTGTVLALDALWGRDAERFEERLRAAESWDDRFALAAGALARRRERERERPVDREVAYAWQQLASTRGQARVEELAAEIGWSRKRLWSRFRTQIGVSPKRAAQLIRFDHATHRLAAGHSPARVAAEGGFADQSHLSREVMTFAGLTPGTVATADWLAVDDVAWSPGAR